VSNKTYNASRAEAMRLESELSALRSRAEAMGRLNDELNSEKSTLQNSLLQLTADYDALRNRYSSLEKDHGNLSRDIEQLREMLDKGNAEASRMLLELQRNQSDLEERSQRVAELEALLQAREEAIASIRRQVSDALLGFEGKGLTISTRDGKVYVSMEDKLLFRSGSYEIGRDGEKAVRDLSKVLAANPDINVMVEGHTDDVRYTPNAYLKDNLDLSAKRATTVVRLLLENKEIAPERIIAAGRGESLPVAEGKTAEARAKNRRTEIILTPKYDELMKLMESTK
jgi:chemotaxis protein MotB